MCGKSRIFLPVLKLRRFSDWYTPLDGCPRCGYAYEREPGYFLMSIWAINYGCGSLLGIILYVIFEWNYDWPIPVLLMAVMGPVVFFNFFFVRHSKSYFLALDHFWDPHRREGGDDGGNLRPPDAPAPVGPGVGKPVEPDPCETVHGVR